MKPDIENRADIDLLMQNFYQRALADDVIGYIFTDVAHLDLESHLPIIGDFGRQCYFVPGLCQPGTKSVGGPSSASS
ncbi:MAG: group III truncated hemoglobin [Chloracidobacterium sp.]|nr:group III truncated hemoglobin [Chloracidobacterium sp.]